MRNLQKSAVGIFLLFLFLSSTLSFSEVSESRGSTPPGPSCPDNTLDPARKGGELPDPLSVYNQRVELAPDELYLLVGTVRILPDLKGESSRVLPYLEVDFRAQPWLASAERVRSPYYELVGGNIAWRSWEGREVRIAARAHQIIVGAEPSDLRIHLLALCHPRGFFGSANS